MSYKNPRIDLMDSMMSAVIKMTGGNPGAMRALMEVCSASPTVDPDCAFGALGPILSLDTMDVYEDRIWMFYRDVCGDNVVEMLGLMRANQLGFLSEARLVRAIDGIEPMEYGEINGYLSQVKARLPSFNIPAA